MNKKEAVALPALAVATGVAVVFQAKKLAFLSGLALVGIGLNAAMRTAAEIVSAVDTSLDGRSESRRPARPRKPRRATRAREAHA